MFSPEPNHNQKDKNMTAKEKLDNLETLSLCAKEQGLSIGIILDEDGYYIIGKRMFPNYRSALKYIIEEATK
jgi:hypothetical protein